MRFSRSVEDALLCVLSVNQVQQLYCTTNSPIRTLESAWELDILKGVRFCIAHVQLRENGPEIK
jgi:hypothetical protein